MTEITTWDRECVVCGARWSESAEGENCPECESVQKENGKPDTTRTAADWERDARAEADARAMLEDEIERLRELLRGFRDHYGDPAWHDKVHAEIGAQKMADTKQTMGAATVFAALTDKQKMAVVWLWPGSRRPWGGDRDGLHDPSASTLGALVRRGVATKTGGDGFPAHYDITPLGQDIRPLAIAAMRQTSAEVAKS